MTMRLFVSLPLDDAMRRHVQAIAGAVLIRDRPHDVKWVPPENLHITLKFLGRVADGEVPEVIAALRQVRSIGPVQIAAGAPDSTRHQGRVHLISTEMKDIAGGLAALREAIERTLEPLGFAREKRPFWPHVTIGRSKRGVRMGFERFSARGVASAVDRFELVSSTPRPEGSLYIPVATFPLIDA